MAENTSELFVGTLVLSAAVGFALYAASVTGTSVGGSGYSLSASFRSVEGVKVGTDVRLAGVKVGSISGLELNPETFRADAYLSIQDSILIPDDSAISISSEGLLGGNFVEIIPGGSSTNLDEGGEIEDTQGSVSLITLLMKFVAGDGE
ncbi:MAG: outer membrane lipid asymmetry maintenance protein MlaD [Litoreibacter sp.]